MATLDDLLAVAQSIQADVRSATERSAPAAEPSRGLPERISGAFENVARGAGRAQTALTSFVGTFDRVISSLGAGMARFVQLANPATVFRFNLAVENATSALGRVLVPVMEQFTAIIQKLGNAVESLSPEAKKLVGGLALGGGLAGVFAAVAAAGALLVGTFGGIPVLVGAVVAAIAGVVAMTAAGSKSFMAAMDRVLKAVGSLAQALATGLVPILEGVLVPALETMAVTLKAAADAVTELANAADVLAGGKGDYDPNRRTALATRAAQMGDLRSYANRAYTSAFNSQGAAEDVAKAHLAESKRQTDILRLILRASGGAISVAAVTPRPVARALGRAAATSPAFVLARMAGIL